MKWTEQAIGRSHVEADTVVVDEKHGLVTIVPDAELDPSVGPFARKFPGVVD